MAAKQKTTRGKGDPDAIFGTESMLARHQWPKELSLEFLLMRQQRITNQLLPHARRRAVETNSPVWRRVIELYRAELLQIVAARVALMKQKNRRKAKRPAKVAG